MSLSWIEESILAQVVDLPAWEDNFPGEGVVRDEVRAAVQELGLFGGTSSKRVLIPLREEVGVYLINEGEPALGIEMVRLSGQRRPLRQVGLTQLSRLDSWWLRRKGTPEAFLPLDFRKILFWPRPTSDGEVVEAVIDTADLGPSWGSDDLGLRRSWDRLVLNRVLAMLYLRIPGRLQESKQYMQEYLQGVSGINVLTHALAGPMVRELKENGHDS